jgi:hypothetical protein
MAAHWNSETRCAYESRVFGRMLDLAQISSRLQTARTPALLDAFPWHDVRLVSSRDRARLILDALGGSLEQDGASRAATASLMRESSTTVLPTAWFEDLPDGI